MNSAVILSVARTAVGTARKGTLANTSAEELAIAALKGVVQRSGLSPEQVDDVIMAESLYGGGVVARYAAIAAGMTGISGMALNRHCAGSLTSTGVAAAQIMSGMEDVVIAGGVQSSSTAPKLSYRIPGTDQVLEGWAPPSHEDRDDAPNRDMTVTVGWNTAKECGITRQEMDAWALRSHERALAAIDAGNLEAEIVPVMAPQLDGSVIEFKVDENPRRGSTIEKLASLQPLHPEIEGFSVTAGNSSSVNDCASALLLSSDAFAKNAGIAPLAKVLAWNAVGVDPYYTGMAPISCITKLLEKSGRKISDIALWEINEAFASVPIAACKKLGINDEIVNISGSGCSIGHPIAASGGRMLATLIYDLKRRGGGLGVATMCAGGGMAGAVLIEV